MISNEDFLAGLDKSVDYDNLPSLDDAPDIFKIKGEHDIIVRWKDGTITTSRYHFGIDEEYASEEAAQQQIDRMNEEWDKNSFVDHIQYTVESKTDRSTLKIIKTKPSLLVSRHFEKSCRDRILAGEEVFPMYLP